MCKFIETGIKNWLLQRVFTVYEIIREIGHVCVLFNKISFTPSQLNWNNFERMI